MSPHTKGKEQAPVTLENISGEKKQQQKQSLGRGGGMAERTSWAEKNPARRKPERAQ